MHCGIFTDSSQAEETVQLLPTSQMRRTMNHHSSQSATTVIKIPAGREVTGFYFLGPLFAPVNMRVGPGSR